MSSGDAPAGWHLLRKVNQMEIIALLIRHMLTLCAGLLIEKGLINPTQADAGVGAVLALVAITWSIVQKIQQKKKHGNDQATVGTRSGKS